jgi:hypothetical protein
MWISFSIALLLGAYFLLPEVAEKTFLSIQKIDSNQTVTAANSRILAVAIIALTSIVALAAGVLLGRLSLIEFETAARLSGLADAFCIAGNDIAQLEKAASILVPKTRYLSATAVFSAKDLRTIGEILKQVK